MKHYVFHLISVVLLVGMLIAVLQLVRSNQVSDQELDKVSGNAAAAGQLLEKERAENAQLLEQERAEHSQALEQERAEHAQTLEKERAESAETISRLKSEVGNLNDNLSILEESVAGMERGFKVVSARDTETLGLTFEQTPRSDADAAAAVAFADTLKNPTPAEFKEAAEKTLEALLSTPRELVLDPNAGYVVDPVAAIVETAAKAAGLSASTTIFWDLQNKAFRSEVAVSDPAKKAKDAVVSVNSSKRSFSIEALQRSAMTTVFLFKRDVFNNKPIDLVSREAPIPVGGLYVHYFRVYSKGPWVLEYVFPEGVEPESVNMNILPFTPGLDIASTVTGRIMKIQSTGNEGKDGNNWEADFLVIADKPFFPESLSIRLK